MHGTKGALAWSFERMNELRYFRRRRGVAHRDQLDSELSGPAHPFHRSFNPGWAVGTGRRRPQGHRGLQFAGGGPRAASTVRQASRTRRLSPGPASGRHSWDTRGWEVVGGAPACWIATGRRPNSVVREEVVIAADLNEVGDPFDRVDRQGRLIGRTDRVAEASSMQATSTRLPPSGTYTASGISRNQGLGRYRWSPARLSLDCTRPFDPCGRTRPRDRSRWAPRARGPRLRSQGRSGRRARRRWRAPVCR